MVKVIKRLYGIREMYVQIPAQVIFSTINSLQFLKMFISINNSKLLINLIYDIMYSGFSLGLYFKTDKYL